METFLTLLIDIILPIFIMIVVGFAAQKLLKMEVRTFTKLNMHVFVPSLLFTKIYETQITWQLFGNVLIYILSICAIMFILGEIVSRLLKYPQCTKKAFVNSLLFFNSGNYGLPLVELAFKNSPVATTAQIFIMFIQNITSNTFGVFQACAGNVGYKKALKNVFAMPSMFVLLVVIPIKVFQLQVPEFIMLPLHNISGGFVAFALITLGVQLAEVKVAFNLKNIFVTSIIRLVLSPLCGLLLVNLLGIQGILAKSLIIGVATPTAVNTAIIAKEFNNEPEYASQIVFATTILSAITIPVILYLMG
ncbi:MAG: AEC family transporter [Clostridiaceae bacterium]